MRASAVPAGTAVARKNYEHKKDKTKAAVYSYVNSLL